MKAQALKSVRELESQLGEVVEDLEAEKEVNTILSIFVSISDPAQADLVVRKLMSNV